MGAPRGELWKDGEETSRSVEIMLEKRGLEAIDQRGGCTRARYAELTVDVAEGVERTFVLRGKEKHFLLTSLERRVLEVALANGATPAGEHVVEFAKKKKGPSRYRATIILGAVFTLLLAIVLAPFYVPIIAAASIDSLPTSIDERIGEAAFQKISLGPEVEDPVLQAAIRDLTSRLVAHARAEGFEIRATVILNPDPNAFALPGGRLFVTTGLLRFLPVREHVAAVMAHEIAHVTGRHSVRSLARSSGLILAAKVLASDEESLVSLAAGAAAGLKFLQHSRENETAADLESARILIAAGIEGKNVRDALDHLQRLIGDPGTALPDWASTHPDLKDRIKTLDEALPKLPVPVIQDLGIDWAMVRERAIRRNLSSD